MIKCMIKRAGGHCYKTMFTDDFQNENHMVCTQFNNLLFILMFYSHPSIKTELHHFLTD